MHAFVKELGVVAKTFLQKIVFLVIQGKPRGAKFHLHSLYAEIKDGLLSGGLPKEPQLADLVRALRECASRGDLPGEPRFKNDIRWAIRFAKEAGLVKHTGTPKSGEWLRI